MTAAALPESLEAFPIPPGAVLLDQWSEQQSRREMVIAAVRHELKQRRLTLPLGPELDMADPDRLLTFNGFSLQLAAAGLLADQVAVDQRFWLDAASAPQLLLAALVDDESGVVQLQGVLTGPELQQQLTCSEQQDGQWLLPADHFKGGLNRLLTLVQLLEPDAIPRLALAANASGAGSVIDIAAWLQGRLDQALEALGAVLLPPPATSAGAPAAFRAAAAPTGLEDSSPLAVLAIPLGLTPEGQLVTGEAARQCIETFQLLLIPSCRLSDGVIPDALILQLTGTLSGDLLPDGLEISATQGRLRQSASTNQSYALSLRFSGREPIAVALRSPAGEPLQLPPLQLPQP